MRIRVRLKIDKGLNGDRKKAAVSNDATELVIEAVAIRYAKNVMLGTTKNKIESAVSVLCCLISSLNDTALDSRYAMRALLRVYNS